MYDIAYNNFIDTLLLFIKDIIIKDIISLIKITAKYPFKKINVISKCYALKIG